VHVLAKSGSEDAMKLYVGFRGAKPKIEPRRRRQQRVSQVLRQGRDPTGHAAITDLVKSIYAHHLWTRQGQRRKSRTALAAARKSADALHVALEPLLKIPVSISQVDGGYSLARAGGGGGARARRGQCQGERTFLPPGHSRWWTGNPGAYLDLVYRRLPGLIVDRLERAGRGASDPTLRIWHVGYDDASQTFFLAAAVAEVVARLTRARPELRERLKQLRVEITATDFLQRPARRGRVFRFGGGERIRQAKSPLLLSEFGSAAETRGTRRRIRVLERRLPAAPGEADAEAMQQLARAGKVGQLLERFFTLSSRVELSRAGQPLSKAPPTPPPALLLPAHHLQDRRWRVEDRANGGLLNRAARGRRIRFVLSDVTREAAGRLDQDLVVCTNVLTYLGAYGGSNSELPAALDRIEGALHPRGALLVDGITAASLRSRQPAFVQKMARGRRSLWVTTSAGLVEDVRQISRERMGAPFGP
jgi:hypothetical protein